HDEVLGDGIGTKYPTEAYFMEILKKGDIARIGDHPMDKNRVSPLPYYKNWKKGEVLIPGRLAYEQGKIDVKKDMEKYASFKGWMNAGVMYIDNETGEKKLLSGTEPILKELDRVDQLSMKLAKEIEFASWRYKVTYNNRNFTVVINFPRDGLTREKIDTTTGMKSVITYMSLENGLTRITREVTDRLITEGFVYDENGIEKSSQTYVNLSGDRRNPKKGPIYSASETLSYNEKSAAKELKLNKTISYYEGAESKLRYIENMTFDPFGRVIKVFTDKGITAISYKEDFHFGKVRKGTIGWINLGTREAPKKGELDFIARTVGYSKENDELTEEKSYFIGSRDRFDRKETVIYELSTGLPKGMIVDNDMMVLGDNAGEFQIVPDGKKISRFFYGSEYGRYGIADKVRTYLVDSKTGKEELLTTSSPVASYVDQKGYHLVYQINDERKSGKNYTYCSQEVKDGAGLLEKKYSGYFDNVKGGFIRQEVTEFEYDRTQEWSRHARSSASRTYIYDAAQPENRGELRSESETKGWFIVKINGADKIVGVEAQRKDWSNYEDFSSIVKGKYSEQYYRDQVVSRLDEYSQLRTDITYDKYGDEELSKTFDLAFHSTLIGRDGKMGFRQSNTPVVVSKKHSAGVMENPYLPGVAEQYYSIKEVSYYNHNSEALYTSRQWFNKNGEMALEMAIKKDASGNDVFDFSYYFNVKDLPGHYYKTALSAASENKDHAFALPFAKKDISRYEFLYFLLKPQGNDNVDYNVVVKDNRGKAVTVGKQLAFWGAYPGNKLYYAEKKNPYRSSGVIVNMEDQNNGRDFVRVISIEQLRLEGLDISNIKSISLVYKARNAREDARFQVSEMKFLGKGDLRSEKAGFLSYISYHVEKYLAGKKEKLQSVGTGSRGDVFVNRQTGDSNVRTVYVGGNIRWFDTFEYTYDSEKGVPKTAVVRLYYDKGGKTPLMSVDYRSGGSPTLYAIEEKYPFIILSRVDPLTGYTIKEAFNISSLTPDAIEWRKQGNNIFLPYLKDNNILDAQFNRLYNRRYNNFIDLLPRLLFGELDGNGKMVKKDYLDYPAFESKQVSEILKDISIIPEALLNRVIHLPVFNKYVHNGAISPEFVNFKAQEFKNNREGLEKLKGQKTYIYASHPGSEHPYQSFTFDNAMLIPQLVLTGDTDSAKKILMFFDRAERDPKTGLFYQSYDIRTGKPVEFDNVTSLPISPLVRTGSNSFYIMEGINYYLLTGDKSHMNTVLNIAENLVKHLHNGNGGFILGPSDKEWKKHYSAEENIDAVEGVLDMLSMPEIQSVIDEVYEDNAQAVKSAFTSAKSNWMDHAIDKKNNLVYRGMMEVKMVENGKLKDTLIPDLSFASDCPLWLLSTVGPEEIQSVYGVDPDDMFKKAMSLFVVRVNVPGVGKVAGVDFNIPMGREDAIFPEQSYYLIQVGWVMKGWHEVKAAKFEASGDNAAALKEKGLAKYYSDVIEYFSASMSNLRNSKLGKAGLLPYAISVRNGKLLTEAIETGHYFASPVSGKKGTNSYVSIITLSQAVYAETGFIPNQPYGGEKFKEMIKSGKLAINKPSADIKAPVLAFNWPFGVRLAVIAGVLAAVIAGIFAAARSIRSRGAKNAVRRAEIPAENAAGRVENLIESTVDTYISRKFSALSTKEKNDIIRQIVSERRPRNTVGLKNVASIIRGKPVASLKVTAAKIWIKAVAEGLISEEKLEEAIRAALDKFEVDMANRTITLNADFTFCNVVLIDKGQVKFKDGEMAALFADMLVFEAFENAYGKPVVDRLVSMLVEESKEPVGMKEAIGKHIEKIFHAGKAPAYDEVVTLTLRQIVWERSHLWGEAKRTIGTEYPFVKYLLDRSVKIITKDGKLAMPEAFQASEQALKEELANAEAIISRWQDFTDLLIFMMDKAIEGRLYFKEITLADGSKRAAIFDKKDGSEVTWEKLNDPKMYIAGGLKLDDKNREIIEAVFKNDQAIASLMFLYQGIARRIGLFGKIGLAVRNIYKYQPDEAVNFYFRKIGEAYFENIAKGAAGVRIEDKAFAAAGEHSVPDLAKYLKFSEEFVKGKKDWASLVDAGMFPKLWALGFSAGLFNIAWSWIFNGTLDMFGVEMIAFTLLHILYAGIKNGLGFFKTVKEFWFSFEKDINGKPILFGTKEKVGFAKIGLWIAWNTIIFSAGKAFFLYRIPYVIDKPELFVVPFSFIFLYGMIKLGNWAYTYFVEGAYTAFAMAKDKQEMPGLLAPLVDMPNVALLHPLVNEAFDLKAAELLKPSLEVAIITLMTKRPDLYRKVVNKKTQKLILEEIKKEAKSDKVLIVSEAVKKVLPKEKLEEIVRVAAENGLAISLLEFLRESYYDSYKEFVGAYVKEGKLLAGYEHRLMTAAQANDFEAYNSLLDALIKEGRDIETFRNYTGSEEKSAKEVIKALENWANEYEPTVMPTIMQMVYIRACMEEWITDYYGLDRSDANTDAFVRKLAVRKVFLVVPTPVDRSEVKKLCEDKSIWRPISAARQMNKAATEAASLPRVLSSDIWINYEKGCRADKSSQRRFLNFVCEFADQDVDIGLPERDMSNKDYNSMTKTAALAEQGFGRVFLYGESKLWGPGHYGWHCMVRSDATIESSAVRKTIISEDLITALNIYIQRRPQGKGKGIFARYLRLTKQREVSNEQTKAAFGRWAKGFIQLENTYFVQSYFFSSDISWAEKDARLMRGGFLTTMSIWAVVCTMLLPFIAMFGMDPFSLLSGAFAFVIFGLLHNQAIQTTMAILFIRGKGLWEGIGHLAKITFKNILWFPGGQLPTFSQNAADGMTRGTTTLFVTSPGRSMRDAQTSKDLQAFWKVPMRMGVIFLFVLQIAMFKHNMNLYSYMAPFLATCVALSFLMFSFVFNSSYGVVNNDRASRAKSGLSSVAGAVAGIIAASMLACGGLYIPWPLAILIAVGFAWAFGTNVKFMERFAIKKIAHLRYFSNSNRAFWLSFVLLLNFIFIPSPASILPPSTDIGYFVIARNVILGAIGLVALYVQIKDVREAVRSKNALDFGAKMVSIKYVPLLLALPIIPAVIFAPYYVAVLNIAAFAIARNFSVNWEFNQSRKLVWEMKEWVDATEKAFAGQDIDLKVRHALEDLKDSFARLELTISEKFYIDIRKELIQAQNTYRYLKSSVAPLLMGEFIKLIPENEKPVAREKLFDGSKQAPEFIMKAIETVVYSSRRDYMNNRSFLENPLFGKLVSELNDKMTILKNLIWAGWDENHIRSVMEDIFDTKYRIEVIYSAFNDLAVIPNETKEIAAKVIADLNADMSVLSTERNRVKIESICQAIIEHREILNTIQSAKKLLASIPDETKEIAAKVIADLNADMSALNSERAEKALPGLKTKVAKNESLLEAVQETLRMFDEIISQYNTWLESHSAEAKDSREKSLEDLLKKHDFYKYCLPWRAGLFKAAILWAVDGRREYSFAKDNLPEETKQAIFDYIKSKLRIPPQVIDDKKPSMPQNAPDAVAKVPASLESFTAIDLGIVTIQGTGSYSIEKAENFVSLAGEYQARLKEIIGFAAHYITGPPLNVNLVIEPVRAGVSTIWYVPASNTIHIQIILLSEYIPLEYALFVGHHDLIAHANCGLTDDGLAVSMSVEFLVNNSAILERIYKFLKNTDIVKIKDGNSIGELLSDFAATRSIEVGLGNKYWDGVLKTTVITRPFRGSRKEDIRDVTTAAEEEGARLERLAMLSLLKGEGYITALIAGASSRMNLREAPEGIKQMIGGKTLLSKAAVPVGEVEGKVITYLDAFGISISRLLKEIDQEAVRAGLPSRVFENTIGLLSNDQYRPEHDAILAASGYYGLPEGQIRFFHQPLGAKFVGTPAEVEALYAAKKFKTEQQYREALALAQEVEQARVKNPEVVILEGERDPWGHGEFFHQMVESGELLFMIDSGKKWIFTRNIDNYAAKFDRMFLRILGQFIDQGLDAQPEVCPRAPGLKGGLLIVMEDNGAQQVAEQPNVE
ncbi:MAG: UTP--glucose-1-phosphate uridylyltransferase, partial [Candidatus Omnitrophica bacterium]|nr:UTP--glucose-1-phosphate uridylyltransferase [Candidatus Omnitrophota bacterium]